MNDYQAVPIYLVDDDDAVREALRYVLEGYDLVVADYASGEQFLQQVNTAIPGCLILDSRMPGIDGQQVHERLRQSSSPIKVIFLTGHGDVPMAVKAFRDGASDFHQKPIKVEELLPSVERAQRRSVEAYRHLQYRRQFDLLTPREQALFAHVVSGLTNKQIAEQLAIAVRTVEVHRAHMMEKLGAENLGDLVKIAEALKG